MEQKTKEEIFKSLEVLLSKVLEQVEETAGIKVSSRQERISQGAGALYHKVIDEARDIVDLYATSAKARVAKFR